MTSPFQTLALAKAPIAAWPLEAGSGVDVSGNGLNLTTVGAPGTTGPPIVAGGGASTTFGGLADGFNISKGAGWAALGLQPTNTPFSMIGWGAPSLLESGYFFGKYGEWIWSTKTNGQMIFTSATATYSPGELYAPVPQAAGAWTSPYPYMLGVSYDPVIGEITFTVNGRYSTSSALTSLADASAYHISIGYTPDSTAYWFSGALGHVYLFNRALTVGEMSELFQVGYVAALPAFTDVFDLVTTGFTGAGKQTLTTAGVYQGTVSFPGLPLVDVKGSSGPKTAISGFCSLCGGRMVASESQVLRTVGTGAALGGIGSAQPSHHTCRKLRPRSPAYTPSNPPATYSQFCDAYSRLSYDYLRNWIVRNTPNKPRYFHVNESAVSNTYGGAFVSPALTPRDSFGLAHSAAMLQSYHRLPRSSPLRSFVELVVDQWISVWQVPQAPPGSSVGMGSQGGGASMLYSQNGIDQAGSGTLQWAAVTTLGAQTSAYAANDDFYISQFGQIIWLMAPFMDKSKVQTWIAAYLKLINYYIGPVGNMTTYINSNRNLGVLLGVWIAWKLTGNLGYLEAYEGLWAFNFAPPVLPASSATIATQYPNWWALIKQQWGAAASIFSYTSYPVTTGFGWQQAAASVLPDGSDGSGYFPEFLGGGVAPYGGTLPAFDGDYSQIQLEHLIDLWVWTKDQRYLQYANMHTTYAMPYLDMNGGTIVFKLAVNNGSSLGPAAKITSAIGTGINVIPITAAAGGAFTAGATIVLSVGTANQESLVIAAGGVGASALTTVGNTVHPHAANDDIGETTATNAFFTGWNLDAQRGGRHHAITQWFNAWPLITWGNGLRGANAFTLAQVQQQWAKCDTFDRVNAIGATVGNYNPNTQLIALLANPNYTFPPVPA